MVRIKHRYLLVHILYPETSQAKDRASKSEPAPDSLRIHRPTPDELSPQMFAKAIRNQVLYLYGDHGLGTTSVGLNVKYLSPATSTAIIRCSRSKYQLVWGALTFMTHLPELPNRAPSLPCVMQVVRVSGTIKKAEEEVIKRARAAILKARSESRIGPSGGLQTILGSGLDPGPSTLDETVPSLAIGIEDDDDEEDEEDEEGDFTMREEG